MNSDWMIGGVFLLARDPAGLATWYERYLGCRLTAMDDPEHGRSFYVEMYYREDDVPEQRQHLVYAIMPGDPGPPGAGHIINYRVQDVDAMVAALHESGVETSDVTVGPDADGEGKFVRLVDPEGHRVELWEHLGSERP